MIEFDGILIEFLRHAMPILAAAVSMFLGALCLMRNTVGAGLLLLLSGLSLAASKIFFVLVPLPTVTWTVSSDGWRFESARHLAAFFFFTWLPPFRSSFFLLPQRF
jgi:hypothetical protein